MAKLLQKLHEENMLTEKWCVLIDTLLTGQYTHSCPNWNSGYTRKLTNAMKKIIKIELGSTLEVYNCKEEIIEISEKEGYSANVLRHLRNGIAHGHADIIRHSNEWYIKLEDYKVSGKEKTANCKEKTAYMWMTVRTLFALFEAHEQLVKSIVNTTGMDRKNTKKFAKKESN